MYVVNDDTIPSESESNHSSFSSENEQDLNETGRMEEDGPTSARSEEEIRQLRRDLDASPFDENLHLKVIAGLRGRNGACDLLRYHRKKLAEMVPQPESFYLEWMGDDFQSLLTLDPRYLDNVLESAQNLVRKPMLWCLRLQALIAPDSALRLGRSDDQIRNLFEQAISDVGLFYEDGSLVWLLYRQFETCSPDRVRSIYRRQLRLPMAHMDELAQMYLQWEASQPSESRPTDQTDLPREFSAALESSMEMEVFEKKIRESDNVSDLESSWISYIGTNLPKKLMKLHGIPTALALVERFMIAGMHWPRMPRLVADCLQSSLGLKPAFVIPYAQRTCKLNVGNEDGWRVWMGLLEDEKDGKVAQDFHTIFCQAMSEPPLLGSPSQASLALAYCECLTRLFNLQVVDAAFVRLGFEATMMCFQIPTGVSPDVAPILEFWCRVEAELLGDIDAAHRLALSLTNSFPSRADFWVLRARLHSEFEPKRRLLASGVRKVAADGIFPTQIFEEWVWAERLKGTAASLKTMWDTYMETFTALQAAEARHEGERNRSRKRIRGEDFEAKDPTTFSVTVNDSAEKVDGESTSSGDRSRRLRRTVLVEKLPYEWHEKDLRESELCRPSTIVDLMVLVAERGRFRGRSQGRALIEFEQRSAAKDLIGLRPRPRIEGREVEVSWASETVAEQRLQRTAAEKRSAVGYNDENTLYVTPLPADVTEDEIREILGNGTDILEVRAIRDREQKCRGYAYVQMSDAAAVRRVVEACEAAPPILRDKAVQVKKSAPHERSTDDAARTLHISNIALAAGEDDIRGVFEAAGLQVKAVRLLKDADGVTRRLAHIVFADDASALRALDLDRTLLLGSSIHVQPFRIASKPNKAARSPKKANAHALKVDRSESSPAPSPSSNPYLAHRSSSFQPALSRNRRPKLQLS